MLGKFAGSGNARLTLVAAIWVSNHAAAVSGGAKRDRPIRHRPDRRAVGAPRSAPAQGLQARSAAHSAGDGGRRHPPRGQERVPVAAPAPELSAVEDRPPYLRPLDGRQNLGKPSTPSCAPAHGRTRERKAGPRPRSSTARPCAPAPTAEASATTRPRRPGAENASSWSTPPGWCSVRRFSPPTPPNGPGPGGCPGHCCPGSVRCASRGWTAGSPGRTSRHGCADRVPGWRSRSSSGPTIRRASGSCHGAGWSSGPSGWPMRHRRLVRDHEKTGSSATAWIYVAMIRLMLNRLA